MNKIFFSILLVVQAMAAQAKDTVTIIFAFGPGDNVANYSRALIAEANKLQNNIVFVFDTRPGAGSAVAAQHVLKTPNTILATSAAHWVRSTVYPKDSHDAGQFISLMPQCETAMALASAKYASWNQIPPNQPLTLGLAGLGTTSHLIAAQIATRFPRITLVPYKSPVDVAIAVASRQIDIGIGFASEMQNYEAKGLTILGQTGTDDKIYPVLAKQGFPRILEKMNNPQHLAVPATMDPERFRQLRTILVAAANSASVRERYAVDYCSILDQMPTEALTSWYHGQHEKWQALAKKIEISQ